MSDCQAETREWRGHPLYACDACNVRTTDKRVLDRRCRNVAPDPTPTSSTGLLGPSGDPLPTPEPTHVGGGWYELPDGTRVQGRDAADQATEPTSHDDY